MLALSSVVTAVMLVGCVKEHASSAAAAHTQAAAMTWEDDVPATREPGPPVIVPGEQMRWRAVLRGVELGELLISVGNPGSMEGRQIVVVRARMRSSATATWLKTVHHELTTFIDMSSSLPVYHRREVPAGSHVRWAEVRPVAEQLALTYRDTAGKQYSETLILPTSEVVFDEPSFLMALRTWSFHADTRITANVLREIRIWRIQLVLGGHETIATPLGKQAAIRVHGRAKQLTRNGLVDKRSHAQSYTFWLSDDTRRLPLAMIISTRLGDAHVELVDYRTAAAGSYRSHARRATARLL